MSTFNGTSLLGALGYVLLCAVAAILGGAVIVWLVTR